MASAYATFSSDAAWTKAVDWATCRRSSSSFLDPWSVAGSPRRSVTGLSSRAFSRSSADGRDDAPSRFGWRRKDGPVALRNRQRSRGGEGGGGLRHLALRPLRLAQVRGRRDVHRFRGEDQERTTPLPVPPPAAPNPFQIPDVHP